MTNKVGAIIVTFNSGNSVLHTINSVLPQVQTLCIIDNNSDKETREILEKIQTEDNKINTIFNSSNMGLGSAYNTGIKILLSSYCENFLLLDDDSVLNDDYVSCMIEASKHNPNCILGGNFFESNAGIHKKYEVFKSFYFYKTDRFINGYIDAGFVISSGSFFSKNIFLKVGDFKESLFIDYIDIEYSLRAKSNHINSIIVQKAKFVHKMGNAKGYNLLGTHLVTKNHSPIRRYYIYRNRVVLWKRHYKNTGYMIWDIVCMIWDLLRIVTMESCKFIKIKYTFLGFWDGIRNSLGKCPYRYTGSNN